MGKITNFFSKMSKLKQERKDNSARRAGQLANDLADAKVKIDKARAEKIRAKTDREIARSEEYYKTKRTKARWRRATQMVASVSASAAAKARAQAEAVAKANSQVNVWNSIINGNQQDKRVDDNTNSTSQIGGGENIRA